VNYEIALFFIFLQTYRKQRTLLPVRKNNMLQIYQKLKRSVDTLYHIFGLKQYEHTKGRKPALSVREGLSLGLYKQSRGSVTKKSVYDDLSGILKCSYKTFVTTINRYARIVAFILIALMKKSRGIAHIIKHIDATDIPVCLNKNASRHRTMRLLSAWGRSGKGFYFGLKLHLVADLSGNLLGFCFTPANVDDRKPVKQLIDDMEGIFIADAGYISEQLAHDLCIEGKRIFMARAKKNMKQLMSRVQQKLYDTRMLIEQNFRSMKMFFGLVTSLPRSTDGYLGNYLYTLLAYVLR